MSLRELDYIFPFVVFAYGAMMVLFFESNFMQKLARVRLSDKLYTQIHSHRILAWVSLIVGSLWSLQNIWLS